MKFSCEACAARYYMDDEKVRHKTLRIRCMKCGNVMTVGDGETTLSEQGSGPDLASIAPREHLQPTADSVWFYAAAGQTYGPYAEGELLRRFETGRIAEEVHVWKQGFEAWLPAGEVEAFAAAIQHARPSRQLTQSIDIGALNLAPVAPASRDSPFAHARMFTCRRREPRHPYPLRSIWTVWRGRVLRCHASVERNSIVCISRISSRLISALTTRSTCGATNQQVIQATHQTSTRTIRIATNRSRLKVFAVAIRGGLHETFVGSTWTNRADHRQW